VTATRRRSDGGVGDARALAAHVTRSTVAIGIAIGVVNGTPRDHDWRKEHEEDG
jgi:hypothetical protein